MAVLTKITSRSLADNAVSSAKIQDGAIAVADVADGSISTAKLADDAVTTAKIANDQVTAAKIPAGAVVADVGAGGITDTQLATNAVTTVKIANDAVDADKLASNAVVSASIVDANITAAKIADANITAAKLSSTALASVEHVKPHIQPGTLYPAWRGLLNNNNAYKFTDSSPSAHTITPAGQTSFITKHGQTHHSGQQKKVGSTSLGFALNASGNEGTNLEIADHADWDFGTGAWTIETWVYLTRLDVQQGIIEIGGDADDGWRVFSWHNSSGLISSRDHSVSGDYSITATGGTGVLTVNTWHHLAVSRASAGVVTLYVDGVAKGTATPSGNLNNDGSGAKKITIGNQYNTSAAYDEYFSGFMDEIRITRGVNVYTGAFTPQTTALTTTWSAGTNIAANSTAGNVKLLIHSDNGGNVGAYGTTQADGHQYYYTDIKGSKPIKDPRIGAHFGSQRHTFRSIQEALHESSDTTGSYIANNKWFNIDGRDWARTSCPNFAQTGLGPKLDFTRGTHDTYEVTGYFSDINILTNINDGTRTVKIELDGTLKQAALDIGGAVNSPYIANNRFVESGSVVNAGIGTTPLGIHTIRVTRVGGNTYHTGIEFIAQDTTDANTKVKIQIPAQKVVSYGKKFSLSATAQHYNPFAFAADGTTAVAIGNAGAHGKVSAGWSGTTANHFDSTLDTATSMGLTAWEKGGNYWRPVNGGRIVKWIDSSGAIKTSVNMMPPSASGYFSAGITPTGTNEPDSVNWPATYAPSFHTKSPDPTLAEVSRVFMFPEFGNGSANLGPLGQYADASMLTTADNITFTLDDGSTSLSAKDWNNSDTYYNRNSTASRLWLTFIGTGLTMNTITHGQFNIVQNLPYGSHIFAIEIAANADNGDWKIDGQLIHSHQSGPGSHAIYNYNPKRDDSFTFFQPKKPPIPDDAVVIADYMLMADFVPVGSTDTRHISKGTRAVGVGRDFWLDRAGGSGTMMIAIPSAGDRIFGWDAHGDQMTARLPMFATNYVQRGYDSDNRTRLARDASTLLDDGTAGGGSAVTVTSGTSYGTYAHLTTDLTLGVHNLGWNSHSTSTNANSNRVEIASPIHTSSHYQEFETPWLREFIGGDRNMEQTNLVVTADGKTWGNINRDMSHIGNLSLSVDCDSDTWTHDNQNWTFEECRGLNSGGGVWGPEYGNKDWAIATTKHICLREGIYNIHFYSLRQDNIGHMYFKRNGTAIGGLHHSSGDEYDVQTLTLCAYFMRGDIFEIFDQGHGALWSHLFITRQDNEHKEQNYLIK